MKKFVSFLLSVLLIAALLASCSGPKEKEIAFTKDEIKEFVIEELDLPLEEDTPSYEIKKCEVVNGNYVVEVLISNEENEKEGLSYTILIDGTDGTFLKIESESKGAYDGDYASGDIGKEAIKEIVLEEVDGATDDDVILCEYCNVDEDFPDGGTPERAAFYNVIVYKGGKLYSFELDAADGEIVAGPYIMEIGEEEKNSLLKSTANDDKSFSVIENVSSKGDSRPVWIIAHRCNTNYSCHWKGACRREDCLHTGDMIEALRTGCNGVEVDIRHRSCDDTLRLCHTNSISIFRSESVEDFLDLPFMNHDNMCVVYFNIKEPEHIGRLIGIVHDAMDNKDNKYPTTYESLKKINFIYSVSSLSSAYQYFTNELISKLRDNEGLCIDYSDEVDKVNVLYNNRKVKRGIYGNGVFSGTYGKGTKAGCKKAVQYRDDRSTNPYNICRVGSWTSHGAVDLETRLGWGIDSVIVAPPLRNNIKTELPKIYGVHLATRNEPLFN